MSAPTFKQLEKRQDREADTDDIRAALGMIETELTSTRTFLVEKLAELMAATGPDEKRDIRDEILDGFDEVRRYVDIAKDDLREYVELADYGPNYPALAEGVERLRDSVRDGLHDEPKSVPEFALALDDLLRDTDAI